MAPRRRGLPHYRRASPLRQLLMPALEGLVLALVALYLIHTMITSAGAPWERSWLLSIHAHVDAVLTAAALGISRLAYPAVLVVLIALLAGWWVLYGDGWKAGVLVTGAILLGVVDYVAKRYFARPRPELFPHPFLASASFPSGDALFAVGFYGLIAFLALASARQRTRRAGWFLWVLVALAMGAGRLVLGVHWPTDVLAGYAAGAIMLCFLAVGARRVSGRLPHRWR